MTDLLAPRDTRTRPANRPGSTAQRPLALGAALAGLVASTAVLMGCMALGLVGWFFAQLLTDGPRVGLSERVAAGAQALWPMVAAWSSRRIR